MNRRSKHRIRARPDGSDSRAGARSGAVLVFTLIMIFMTSVALFLFIEKAVYEIRSEAVHIKRDRLRPHAYSVMEAVMAVLLDVREIDGSLYDPRQGWENPLEYAGVELPESMRANVSFHDESGKLPLAQMDRERLMLLFERLDFDATRIEDLADALLAWVDESQDQDRVGGGFSGYDSGELPYRPSHEPLKSLRELAAVEGFRDLFFDANGVPTDAFYRFANLVSLRDFGQVNVNSASSEVLRVWGNYTETEPLRSAETYREEGTRGDQDYFENLDEANAELGMSLPGGQFGTTIRFLRVEVRLSEGDLEYRVSAVFDLDTPAEVTPPEEGETETRTGGTAQQPASGERASVGDHTLQNFPFTILELRENASIVY